MKLNWRREVNNTVDTTKINIFSYLHVSALYVHHQPNGRIFKETINFASVRNEMSFLQFTYLINYLLTNLLTYLLTYLPTYLFTYLLTYLLTYLPTHSMEQSPSWEPTVFQLIKKFPEFYGTQILLPHSQVPSNCLYPEPARFSLHTHIPLPEDPS